MSTEPRTSPCETSRPTAENRRRGRRVARAAEHLGDNLHTLELNPVWVRDPQVEILDALIAVHSAED
jgi:hypothetical protein